MFGGRSAEHEVSIVSARSVYQAIDRRKFDPVLIGITKQGRWITGPADVLLSGKNLGSRGSAIVIPDPAKPALFQIKERNMLTRLPGQRLDVLFPVLHGTYGEDGTIQGLFELTGIPYVGSGVLGSAVGMDKVVQKQVFEHVGLPVVRYRAVARHEWNGHSRTILHAITRGLVFPVFVKPANLGSSVGISNVRASRDLSKAVRTAFQYDTKVIVEQGVRPAREFECAVLGNNQPRASSVGEIRSSGDFYDYDAKYVDGQSKILIPAPIPKKLAQRIRRLAVAAFSAVNASGLARVDFLYDGRRLFVNEINTMPGFTSISMYPKLWQHQGVSYRKLIETLIRLALQRKKSQQQLAIGYRPKRNWHQAS